AGALTLDDLLGAPLPAAEGEGEGEEGRAEGDVVDVEPESTGPAGVTEVSEEGEDFRDVALAAETAGREADGREGTSPPSNADQDETNRIVTEAVESGDSREEAVAREAGAAPNVPPLPSTERFDIDEPEERDSEAHQP